MRKGTERARVADKNFSEPPSVLRPTAEMTQILREKIAAQRLPGAPGAAAATAARSVAERAAPILLVQDYRGDSRAIQDAARGEGLHGHSCDAASGSELVRLLARHLEWSGEKRPDFLVLDLRIHNGNAPAILREISSEPICGDVPLAILTSAEFGGELAERELRAAPGAWRMSRVSNATQVAQALKSVLRL